MVFGRFNKKQFKKRKQDERTNFFQGKSSDGFIPRH